MSNGTTRRFHRRTRSAGGVLAAAALAALLLSDCSAGGAAPAASSAPPTSAPASTPATNPLTGQGEAGHVLAVKIDNVGPAQTEHAGLNGADLVYAIQVEGGLSRYLAVYDSKNAPEQVGPVRSARQTDIPLLEPFGRVGLAYSGAISGLLPQLAKANVQNITPTIAPNLFSNGGSDPTFIRPAQVFDAFPDLAQAKDVGFRFGAEPAGGQPATSAAAQMPSASFAFTASGTQWLVSVDGRPAMTTSSSGSSTEQVSADNVIIQHVNVVPGEFTDHNAGHADNEVFSQTTGSGQADFYRDGKVWHGQWSKANDGAPTNYTLSGGGSMQLTPGRTWIVLEG